MSNELLSVDEAATLAERTPRRIRDLANSGTFPNAKRFGVSWAIPRDELEAYIKNRKKAGRPISTGAGLRRKDRQAEKI